jgi:PhoH-like ATPase
MTKTFILDTNVLLDDPSALFAFKNNDIVLPYKVIEELEKHKTSQGEIGMNARDCGRKIADLFNTDNKTKVNLKEGIDLPSGGKLKVLSEEDVAGHNIPLHSPDDHILAVAVGFNKTLKKDTVTLITNDVLLRLRASSNGLDVEGYNGTVDIGSLEELYTGYNSVEVSNATMSSFWIQHGQDKDHFNVPVSKVSKNESALPNDFFILNDQPKALVRYMEDGSFKFVPEEQAGKIKPRNIEQTMALDLLMDPTVDMVTLTGISGCGKTLLALAAGLHQVMDRKMYSNVLVIRPIHSVGKEIGFLPGTKEEKMEPWMAPIKDNIRFCLSNDNGRKSRQNRDTMEYVMDKGWVEIEAMTFIRGRSINNAFIIIDEAQNVNVHELKAILTRVGEGTKIVLTGDIEQTDRTDVDSISNGLAVAIEKFKSHGISGHVSMKEGLRSKLSALAAKIL